MRDLIEQRLKDRTTERDTLGAEFQALRQRIQEVEGQLVRASIVVEELEALLAPEAPADTEAPAAA